MFSFCFLHVLLTNNFIHVSSCVVFFFVFASTIGTGDSKCCRLERFRRYFTIKRFRNRSYNSTAFALSAVRTARRIDIGKKTIIHSDKRWFYRLRARAILFRFVVSFGARLCDESSLQCSIVRWHSLLARHAYDTGFACFTRNSCNDFQDLIENRRCSSPFHRLLVESASRIERDR